MVPLGRSHARLRELRELRRSPRRREEAGIFLAEGLHLAEEALACRAPLVLAVVSPALGRVPGGADLRRRLEQAGIEVLETSEAALDGLQEARSPQPVLLVVRRPRLDLAAAIEGRGGVPLAVLAHGLQDPGNLGSILRTADAAGATGLIVSGAGADLFHPRAVRASMGSIFRLPVAREAAGRAAGEIRRRGLATVAADPRAADRLDACDLTVPLALIVGAEGAGLPPELAGAADRRVRIPMHPGVESLSAPAAAAVLLYEAARQRRTPR